MPNYFRNPDALVDAVRAVLSGQPVEEKMDPVDPKALKGKHKDRKDKDIDNDGDVDSSDEYLHNRRQAISKAMKEEVELDESLKGLGRRPRDPWSPDVPTPKDAYHPVTGKLNKKSQAWKDHVKKHYPKQLWKQHGVTEEVELDEDIIQKYRDEVSKLEAKKNKTSYEIGRLKKMKQRLRKIDEETDDNPANTQHLCAKNVVHEQWGEGVCIPTMHADPDAEGNVAWYDIMFEHGIETRVSIEELKVTKAESHMHSSKKKKMKESKDEDEDDMEGETDTDTEKAKKKEKKMDGKKDDVDLEPKMDDQKMTAEMSDKQMKKREEIVKSMKKKMSDFKAKYGDRAKDVMYATATKMAMKEGFELGIEKSEFIEEVELDEKVQFEAPTKDGKGTFQVIDRDTKGMRGTQDKFKMQIVDKRGKVIKDLGSHPSLNGAKGMAKNRGIIEEVELGEAKVTKKERDRLEDQNEHGLLALKLAKAYGTPAEVKKIEAINKKHEKVGHIERKDQQERDSISNKYYKMAEEVELGEADAGNKEAVKKAINMVKSIMKVKKKKPEDAYSDWEKGTTFGPKLKAMVKQAVIKEEVELDEAIKDYEVKIKVGSKTNSYTIPAKDELSAAQSVVHSVIARSKTGGSPGLAAIRKQYPDMKSLNKKGISVSIKEEVELDEALPPHLQKHFDKDGNALKGKWVGTGKNKKWIPTGGVKTKTTIKDVTPKGYGPKEEVELDEADAGK